MCVCVCIFLLWTKNYFPIGNLHSGARISVWNSWYKSSFLRSWPFRSVADFALCQSAAIYHGCGCSVFIPFMQNNIFGNLWCFVERPKERQSTCTCLEGFLGFGLMSFSPSVPFFFWGLPKLDSYFWAGQHISLSSLSCRELTRSTGNLNFLMLFYDSVFWSFSLF